MYISKLLFFLKTFDTFIYSSEKHFNFDNLPSDCYCCLGDATKNDTCLFALTFLYLSSNFFQTADRSCNTSFQHDFSQISQFWTQNVPNPKHL